MRKGTPLKILTVEDDLVARKILVQALHRLGYETVEAADGEEALRIIEQEPIRVIVSDWLMPGIDGLELCRRIRERVNSEYSYFILLSSREADPANQREAIEAGVDDFLTKPLDLQELWMRLRVSERILKFTTQVRQLEAFLPICSYCKKVRDDHNYWQQIEAYINERTGSEFSHSICPDCYQRVIIPELEKLRASMPTPTPKPKVERSN
jgi:CheY-like chemotaxis protein